MNTRHSRAIPTFLFAAAAAVPLVLTPAPTRAQGPTNVTGGGEGVVIDPDGNQYALEFSVAGTVRAGGRADGHINFIFGQAFGQAWGVVPVDLIHIAGRVTAGSVLADGTVVLEGTLTEREFVHGQGVVFIEENSPFRIEVGGPLGPNTLKLTWCLLPDFYVVVSPGRLRIDGGSALGVASAAEGVTAQKRACGA